MHSTAIVPNHVTLRRSALSLVLVTAVVVTAIVTAALIATVDSESSGRAPAIPTNSEILDGLSRSAREFVEGIVNMTPEQLATAYNYGQVSVPATPSNETMATIPDLRTAVPAPRTPLDPSSNPLLPGCNLGFGVCDAFGAHDAPRTPLDPSPNPLLPGCNLGFGVCDAFGADQ